jgi:hypothetical protein
MRNRKKVKMTERAKRSMKIILDKDQFRRKERSKLPIKRSFPRKYQLKRSPKRLVNLK